MLVRRDADEIREIRPRAALGALIVVCAMLVLVVRLYRLQISRGEEYFAQSISNYTKTLPVPAERGFFKDRRGVVMVENRPSFDVFLTPAYCRGPAKEEVFEKLKTYLQLDPDEDDRMRRDYDKAIYSKDKLERFKPYVVVLDIPRDAVDVVEAHKSELTCVDLIPESHRSYRSGNALGHVLGYMSEVTPDELEANPGFRRGQITGRRGLERRWDRELRGEDGQEKIAVDAQGRRLDEATNQLLISEEERLVPPTAGNNLILSLDSRLQELADEAFPGRAGAVVVMEAKTGFLLAMISRPSFDPNKMSLRISRAELRALNEDPLKPLVNRAMAENYHPGSTFKVVGALAGLEKGAIGATSIIHCPGFFSLGPFRWRCDKAKGHGALDVKRALQVSCDVFFYALGAHVGLEGLSETARSLGYGAPTGLDLGHEISGIIPDPAYVKRVYGAYTKGHAVNAAIGQGDVNVTPLQQAVAYAAIGNGGTVFQPQIVKRLESFDGKVLKEFEPIAERKLAFDPVNLAIVRAGLKAVVNQPGGTGYRSRLADLQFSGKTGTAQVVTLGSKQKLDPKKQEYLSRDHAWFVAYAPSEDPEIVVVVLNEHGGWGAEAAAPAASKVIEGYFRMVKEDELAAVKVGGR